MQPYFLPYIGYFQLIAAVDLFVIYDNIEYTKKGWINRNRFLLNGQAETFTVSIQAGSDFLHVRDRRVSPAFDRRRLLARFEHAYRRAPYFDRAFDLVRRSILSSKDNLFDYISFSIELVCQYLDLRTTLIRSSDIDVDHERKGQEKVLSICRQSGAAMYINAIGGRGLYASDAFLAEGIELRFLKSDPLEYKQFSNQFVPSLSIVDVMMFNSPDEISGYLVNGYELVRGDA